MFWKLYLIALPIFLFVDVIWLGLVAKNFYHQKIGSLMKNNANAFAALVFYTVFTFGILMFVVMPGLEKSIGYQVILNGALFGLVAYSAYDFSNLATLKDWPFVVTLVDLLWGILLTSLVSVLTYLIAIKFLQ
jgi:uncharacterized membrane protein